MVGEVVRAARAAIDVLLAADAVSNHDIEGFAVILLDEIVNFNPVSGKGAGERIGDLGGHIAVASL